MCLCLVNSGVGVAIDLYCALERYLSMIFPQDDVIGGRGGDKPPRGQGYGLSPKEMASGGPSPEKI